MPEPPPPFFRRLCERLEASPSLCTELWNAFCLIFPERIQPLLYAFNKLDAERVPRAIVLQRLAHLSGLMSAHNILSASLRVSPEGRKGRRKDIRQSEQRLLDQVGKDGEWL
jgi:hypothetical protein